MESATFRKLLADRGCRFDHHEHHQRGEGPSIVGDVTKNQQRDGAPQAALSSAPIPAA
jgi:hypothetical protein